jgi:phosphatidylglycerophosphatase A
MKISSRPAFLIATVLGCGLSPVAPGTAGSLAGLASAWALVHFLSLPPYCLAILSLGLVPIGIWSATLTAQMSGKKDPGLVVVDELLGQWITLAGAVRTNWKMYLIGFLLFRLFDIWKPYPVRQLESLPAGQGIVADDLMAGLYGALVLFTLGWFNFY